MTDKPSDISADAYLDRPVESLVWGATLLVNRRLRWRKMHKHIRTDPVALEIQAKDAIMETAYNGAIRIRAAEIAAWLDERGLESLPGDLEQDPCLWCYTCGVYLGYAEPEEGIDWSASDG